MTQANEMIKGTVLMDEKSGAKRNLLDVVTVILENGFKVEFFTMGLPKNEYLKRANEIYNYWND